MRASTALDLLGSLPGEIFSSILSSWLTATYVARLDGALCVREHRAWFLQAAYGPTVILHNPQNLQKEGVDVRDAISMWVMRKSAGMELLGVTKCMFQNEAMSRSYLEARGCSVVTVDFPVFFHFPSNDTAVNKITSYIGMFCPNLREFDGYGGHDDEALTAVARGCPLLEDIRLRGHYSDETLEAFAENCHRLRHVSIQVYDDALSEESLVELVQRCRLLETMSIHHEEPILTDTFFSQLAVCCPLLKELDVAHAHVSHVGLDALAAHCGNLHTLSFDSGVIDTDARSSTTVFPALLTLVIYDVEIDDASLDALLQRCPAVTELILTNLQDVTEAGLVAAAARCPLVRSLVFSTETSSVTDAVLRSVADNFSHLRSFAAGGCNDATEAGLCAVIKSHPQLEKLDVSFNFNVSDVLLGDLVDHCHNLRTVDLSGCGITDAGVIALLQGCPHLTRVNISDCYQLKEETRRLLKERFRTC
jgi:hypothetical protein